MRCENGDSVQRTPSAKILPANLPQLIARLFSMATHRSLALLVWRESSGFHHFLLGAKLIGRGQESRKRLIIVNGLGEARRKQPWPRERSGHLEQAPPPILQCRPGNHHSIPPMWDEIVPGTLHILRYNGSYPLENPLGNFLSGEVCNRMATVCSINPRVRQPIVCPDAQGKHAISRLNPIQ